MASFLLRETVNFADENGSLLYVCFLDVRKAFDCVWHELYNIGIDKAIFKILQNLYKGMTSRVKFHGCKSEWFPIQQGTRQGGVISPFLFLVYFNDLLYELERSGLGICVSNLSLSSPTVADDMLVASLSRSGLAGSMRICFIYACLWRFLHAALKSAVVVLNEKRMKCLSAERIWKLGDAIVPENDQYKII